MASIEAGPQPGAGFHGAWASWLQQAGAERRGGAHVVASAGDAAGAGDEDEAVAGQGGEGGRHPNAQEQHLRFRRRPCWVTGFVGRAGMKGDS
jgi:hypothetical protein